MTYVISEHDGKITASFFHWKCPNRVWSPHTNTFMEIYRRVSKAPWWPFFHPEAFPASREDFRRFPIRETLQAPRPLAWLNAPELKHWQELPRAALARSYGHAPGSLSLVFLQGCCGGCGPVSQHLFGFLREFNTGLSIRNSLMPLEQNLSPLMDTNSHEGSCLPSTLNS